MQDFFARAKFLCCTRDSGEKITFSANMPAPHQIKAPKAIIIVKAREEESDQGGFPTGIDKEVVFMEINKPILENLYNICQVSHFSSTIHSFYHAETESAKKFVALKAENLNLTQVFDQTLTNKRSSKIWI